MKRKNNVRSRAASTPRRRGALGNQLIELLPKRDQARLLRHAVQVDLVLEEVLSSGGKPARHVFFPTGGFISMVTQLDGKPVLEVGMVGREGMLGSHLALGVSVSPLYSVVQGAGLAWRIDAAEFRSELNRSKPLQHLLGRYIYVLMAQLAASAGCLRFHEIGPRLARWLLMSQDRAHADTFHVTQEFLAYMLGVRRVGITAAASALKRRGLIAYRRGRMQVLDRDGLESAACGCYATEQRAYAQLLR
jgi:CRP-like cAMP-binding protein